jgi:predicted MPP superfamily phosphohydrolase
MRTMNFVIFLAVFFTIYGLVNFYVFARGWQAIPQGSTLRNAYAIVFWVVVLSFVGGRLLERLWTSAFSDLLVWSGSFWIAAMLYFFIAVVILDLLRLINRIIPFFPYCITANYALTKYIASVAAIGLVAILLLAGHVNSLMPRVRTLDIAINKEVEGMKTVNIVAVSDIHLGTIVGRHRLDRIVERINSLNPDLVLLPGDIVDEDLAPVIKQNLGESLRYLRPRFGVFAVTGNHEYIGGVEDACDYLVKHGVVMLRDQAVKINGSFFLIGREDRSINQYRGKRRKALEELMASIDKKYPVILMDHQPFRLDEAVSHGVDLQLSGHTHDGQLWPVNFIIDAIYEVGWGYKRIINTHVYVSNGIGTWGPPVRIGNRPEIVNIRLSFP